MMLHIGPQVVSVLILSRGGQFSTFHHEFDQLSLSDRTEMQSRLLSVASDSSFLENIVQLSSAAVIIFEHSFYIFDKQRHLQGQQESVPSFTVALEQYITSPHAIAVREAGIAAVRAYEEAMKTPVKGKMPAWMAKTLFELSHKKYLAKAELTKTILEISLNHRLPRP
ncbi:hypothetical protein DFJ58DRAFT_244081 [Suillus subalutaceus]|uniref:uncharacterized protein n=1 Tax=Suillus subalutaceus TaxID=48586 RepID=UPI001B85F762|nr:uncharacterized protein DFJ58DRAFT_244081 [Suillus subalutaceus]KAG1831680.1 hypothetical protein DFJ58DRAFT_244081 [Suillus subalutaceus]